MLFMAASCIAGFYYYSYIRENFSYLKFLPEFLALTLVVELIGNYMAANAIGNIWLYNFFSAITVCFYLNLVRRIISSPRAKKVILVANIVYAIVTFVNILFIQGVKTLHTITFSLGCLLIVAFCIYYFLELFRLPKSVNLKNTPAFWICSGLLFFFCCGMPLYGFFNYWLKVPFIVKNLQSIITILNIFLYSLFTIAFLCVRPAKYTLSSS